MGDGTQYLSQLLVFLTLYYHHNPDSLDDKFVILPNVHVRYHLFPTFALRMINSLHHIPPGGLVRFCGC